MTDAERPDGSVLSEGLGLAPERAAFEAWANDQGFPLERMDTFGSEGDYRDLRTNTAWEGFCVGLAAERERIAKFWDGRIYGIGAVDADIGRSIRRGEFVPWELNRA